MRLGVVDISIAYMQSGLIKIYIYVRPPKEWSVTQRGQIWELFKLPYGFSEAVGQWATVIQDWLINTIGFEQAT